MKEYAPIVGMCLMAVFEKGEDQLKTICNCTIPSHVMIVEYKKFLVKLEDLPNEEKEQLWKYAYELFPYRTKEERMDVCKIIHTIGSLL